MSHTTKSQALAHKKSHTGVPVQNDIPSAVAVLSTQPSYLYRWVGLT